MHELNELLASGDGDLVVNGNTYKNAHAKTSTQNFIITNNRIQFTTEFILGDQQIGPDTYQLPVVGLQDYSRGRKMQFKSQLEDGSYRTFNFWHNFDNIKDYETFLVIKHSFSYGGHARVIKVGGFEKIVCNGWIIGPDTNTRNPLEAYFYNIISGPLGRLGTLSVDGSGDVIENAYLQEMTMEDTTNPTVKYQLTFIASIQC
jgi:hypothetical protein